MASILIVDDDRQVLDSLRQVVEGMGHEAVCASSIAQALESVRSRPFDIVFCDVRMPDGSGLDILPDIRYADPSPEVIIITGYGDPDGAE
ncbi:MAG TPA: response regulator, partial [Burkholderiales bacterium]|nr:response regulator [Burkholderiales bacterium]